MRWAREPAFLVAVSLAVAGHLAAAQQLAQPEPAQPLPIETFFLAAKQDDKAAKAAIEALASAWKDSYAPLILDLLAVVRPPRPSLEEVAFVELPPGSRPREMAGPSFANHPRFKIRRRLFALLRRATRQNFDENQQRWRRWSWTLPYDPHPDYARFKAELYANVDPAMRHFFPSGVRSLIRLDEIEWGGVKVNGIPPLDHPKHVAAGDARYLDESDIVFGFYLHGEARAYPKRILAWHELARDRVGGVELTIVYCTLCGTVIPYESVAGGKLRTLGTSGLLYRSNKLMFDEETKSLWSTLEGKPVVGALAGSGLRLRALPVVTTTWGEWRREHPLTTVLSLDTGYQRDYREGAAYRDYFSHDALMFPVSQSDSRLSNKAEVLVLRLTAPDGGRPQPLAVAADFLRRNRIFHASQAGHDLVVLTSPTGANRVYDSRGVRFRRFLDGARIEDEVGRAWRITEEALIGEGGGAPPLRLARIPAQRAFWFGWFAQFPDTILIK